MRSLPPLVTIALPGRLVQDARLYAPGADCADSDAVRYVLEDYPRLVAEIRALRRRTGQLDDEAARFDQRLGQLQSMCRQILDL